MFLILLIQGVLAVPTTLAATMIGNNNATLNGNAGTGTNGWFALGLYSGNDIALLPNVTISGGAFSYTITGTPMSINTTWYYEACDQTGCGAETFFTLLPVTPIPQTTFGTAAQDMINSGFSPINLVWDALQPFILVTTATVFFGLIFGAVFIGIWLRTRGTLIATQLWMIFAGLAASSATGLYLGLPPEFLALAQALLYVSIAGTFVAYSTK